MKRLIAKLLSVVLVLAFLLSASGIPVIAQTDEPPQTPEIAQTDEPPLPPEAPRPHAREVDPGLLPVAGAQYDPNSGWFVEADPLGPEMSPQATELSGGPDSYGYTWTDLASASWTWVDATTGGTLTPLTYNMDEVTVSLPFSFKYYENVYSEVNLSAYGYMGFGYDYLYDQQSPIPNPSSPNNVVAPFWTFIDLANSGSTNRVYTKTGGESPNRWFAVEWYQVKYDDETYTFEAILYENGDIQFQYGQMIFSGSSWCGSAGIEDIHGVDGLTTLSLCSFPQSNKAVRITRPAADAHVGIFPLNYGKFAHANEIMEYQLYIRNDGELGDDTFDLGVSTTWDLELYAGDGITPLADTNANGLPDTGSLPPGISTSVIARLSAPATLDIGDVSDAYITIRSARNLGRVKNVTLQATVSAPFAQIYGWGEDGSLQMQLTKPTRNTLVEVAAPETWPNELSVLEVPNGNLVAAWTESRCADTACTKWVGEIYYSLVNHTGSVIRGATRLVDLGGLPTQAYDQNFSLAAAPNGRIALAWERNLYNPSTGKENQNIYFAILDPAGSLAYGPLNVTNNGVWSNWSDDSHVRFYNPNVAATANDSRFVLAWEKYNYTSSVDYDDVYIAVRDSSGGQVKAVTKLTNDTSDWQHGYESPKLTPLNNGSSLLVYDEYSSDDLLGVVLNSAGDVQVGQRNLTNDGSSAYDYAYSVDAVQLPNGSIALAWLRGQVINYFLMDGGLNVTRSISTIAAPLAISGNSYPSVTTDSASHIIFTWTDNSSELGNLYYALLDGAGNLLTGTRIAQHANYSLYAGYNGFNNTTYQPDSPPSAGIDTFVKAPLYAGAAPGGSGPINIEYGNKGLSQATSVVLQVTLSSSLTMLSVTNADYTYNPGTHTYTWNLDNLGYLGGGIMTMFVSIPDDPIGTLYPVDIQISSTGEAGNADNTLHANVMSALQIFLPLTTR